MAEKTIMDMFADMGNQFNLPKIDYDALLDTRRKDIDAVQKSLLVLSQGRAFIARQREVFADMIRQSRELIDEFKPRGSPAEIAAKQTDLATRTFEAVAKNTKDIAELVQKSAGEASTIIMNRMREGIAEARAAIEPPGRSWFRLGRRSRTTVGTGRVIQDLRPLTGVFQCLGLRIWLQAYGKRTFDPPAVLDNISSRV